MTLHHFLRYKCSDILRTHNSDGELKISNFYSDKTSHLENMTKSKNDSKRKTKKRNMSSAPKLNYPRNNYVVHNQHPNPQGFNKIKNLGLLGRDPFKDADKNKVANEFKPPDTKITLTSFLDEKLVPNGNNENDLSLINIKLSGVILEKTKKDEEPINDVPSVQNPFEFPVLSRPSNNPFINGEINGSDNMLNAQFDATCCDDIKPMHKQNFPPDDCKSISESYFGVQSDFDIATNTSFAGSFAESVTQNPQNRSVIELKQNYGGKENKEAVKNNAVDDEYLTLSCDDPIFFLDYPDIIKNCDVKIPKPALKYVKKSDELTRFPIFITSVFDPTQFCFQYNDNDEEELADLMSELQAFYEYVPEFGLTFNHKNLKVGLFVAAKIEDLWHRAEIKSISNGGQVTVFFVDFGITYALDFSLLRYMPKMFATTPGKSLRGSLFNVSPKIGKQWTEDARHSFFNKVCNKTIYAIVRAKTEDTDCFELDLTESLTAMKTFSDEFVELNYAKRNRNDDLCVPYATLVSYPKYFQDDEM